MYIVNMKLCHKMDDNTLLEKFKQSNKNPSTKYRKPAVEMLVS